MNRHRLFVKDEISLFDFLTELAVKIGLSTVFFSIYFIAFRDNTNVFIFRLVFILGLFLAMLGLVTKWIVRRHT